LNSIEKRYFEAADIIELSFTNKASDKPTTETKKGCTSKD
jgi:hypothetical protein